MSWFKHKPRPKNPPHVAHPHKSGPIAREQWEQIKERVGSKKESESSDIKSDNK